MIEAIEGALRDAWHNPSSAHRAGQAASRVVELARADLANLVGVKPSRIVFTSCGSEANASVLRSVRPGGSIITSPVQHASIRETLAQMRSEGLVGVRTCGLDSDGVIDVDSVRTALDDSVRLVTIPWAASETGAIQPVEEVLELCRERGAWFHTDATQWVGKLPTDLTGAFKPDWLTFSPHKFHGPKGVGVLVLGEDGTDPKPVVPGAQEQGRRGGTLNVPGIAGAGAAARLARAWLADPTNRSDQGALRDRLESRLLGLRDGACVNGPTGAGARLWSATSIAFPGVGAEAMLLALSERGVCASAGSACASGSHEPPEALSATGMGRERASSSVRFTLSRLSSDGEVDRAVEIVAAVLGTMT